MECRTGDLKDGHAVQDWRYRSSSTGLEIQHGGALQEWRYSTVKLYRTGDIARWSSTGLEI